MATATAVPDAPASAPVTPVVQGEEVTLVPMYYKRVPVVLVSPEDMLTAILAQGRIVLGTPEPNEPENPQALEDLVLSGRMIVVETFTKARLLPDTYQCRIIGPLVKVEITSGPYRGKQGWVEKEWAQKNYHMGG